MTASAASLPSKEKTRSRRIRFSTCVVALFVAGIMALVEIPGRRTGATTYAHGWPWAYLERDYRPDTAGNPFQFNYLTAPSSLADIRQEFRLLDHTAERDERDYRAIDEIWAVGGLTAEAEVHEKLNPWSYDNIKRRAHVWIAPDILVAAAIVVLVALVWQRLRSRERADGRSRFRFRLRTVFIVVAIVGIVLARYMVWRKQLTAEIASRSTTRSIVVPNNDPSPGSAATTTAFEMTWCPPDWLPESLAKIGRLSEDFQRVTCCWINRPNENQKAGDVAISGLLVYPCVRELRLTNCQFTDTGLARLAKLPRLSVLQLPDADISDAALAEIAKISSLTALEIRCGHVTEKGIDELKQLSRLRFLRLRSISDQRFADRLGELTNLEGLALLGPKVASVHLRGMKYLREFATDTPLDVTTAGAPPPARLGSLWLEDLPALELVRLWHTVFSDLRLADLPALREFESSEAALPAAALEECLRAPKLKRLAISNVDISGVKRIEFAGASHLDRLQVDGINSQSHGTVELDFRDSNNLKELSVSDNATLDQLHLGRLPKLTDLDVVQNPKLAAIDLGGLPALESLNMSAAMAAATMHRLPNIRNLTRLRSLSLGIRLDSTLLDDISQLSSLQSLTLSHCGLHDVSLGRLAALRGLTTLDLAYNDLDNSAIPALARLPKNIQLNIDANPIDDSAVNQLKKLRPDLDISINSRKDAMADFQRQITSAATAIHAPSFDFGDSDFALLLPAANRLKQLDLRQTHLTDAGMATIAKLSHLESLDLQATQITDAGLAPLAGLRELRTVDLSSTAILGEGLRHLQNLPKLTTLSLAATGMTDDSLANLRFVPQVERLSLTNSEIGDAGLVHLDVMPHLRVLNLSSTYVTDAGLLHLSKVPSLEKLRLGPYGIEGAGIEDLRSLPKLELLDIMTLPATDALLEHVSRLPHLRSLLLGECKNVSARGIAFLQRMHNLQKLYLISADTPQWMIRIPNIRVVGPFSLSGIEEVEKINKEFEPFQEERND